MGSEFGRASKTEGGEALLNQAGHDQRQSIERHVASSTEREYWYALWTHSHCEQLVRDQLAAREFETFFPKITTWSLRAGARHRILTPMFPGYLFVHEQLTDRRYAELRGVRGLVCLLSSGSGRPATVPDTEIDAVRALVDSDLHAVPHAYLHAGQRVRITEGPLADVEGILIDRQAGKGLLVLSVHLFQRSVAVEVECASAVAA